MQKPSTTRLWSLLTEALSIAFGIGIATLGLKSFLLPNGFLDGGVTGIAILFDILFEWPVALTLPLLSVPFLALAYVTVSRRIFYKSVASILTLVVVLQLVSVPLLTDDKLLIAIFGGLCLGLGIGVTIRNGAVLDGSEILGIFLNDRFGIAIGKAVLLFNVVLFGITAVVVSVEVALYSILTYLVTAEVTDVVIRGFENFIGVTIVSRRSEELQQAILTELGTGLTLLAGRGGYGHRKEAPVDQTIIQTVVNRVDIRRLYALLDEHDPDAFVIEFDVHNVRGGVLRRYFTRH